MATLSVSGPGRPTSYRLGADWSLSPDDIATPIFRANTPGDYVVSLIVVDSRGGLSAPDYATIHVATNLPPVAVATADKTIVTVGEEVCFDGSQSYDPEGGPLSEVFHGYTWDFGDGSPAVFGLASVCHAFESTGTFNVLLRVVDERNAVDTNTVTITVTPPGNQPPVANAGADRYAYTGQTLALLGSAADPDGDAVIAWAWEVDQAPAGATWTLVPTNISSPDFTAYTPGDYVVLLVVTDTFGLGSAPDFATIHVADNLPPVAVATADKVTITVGDTVCFDGSQSYDPEGGPLSEVFHGYTWVFGDGSPAVFGLASVCHAFESTGTFNVLLRVVDERNAVDTNTVTITVNPPGNQPPIANAGTDQPVHAGTIVTLDGSASSDPEENYPLSYSWRIISKPQGSEAELFDSTLVNPSFIPDVSGDYTVELVVTDSLGLQSSPDTVVISTLNTAPVADAGEDQAVIEQGATVQLDGSDSYDLDGDDITYFWTITQAPEESLAVLSDPASPVPAFVADVYGEYVITLVVTDGLGSSSDGDSVTVSFTNVRPVAEAGGNQSVYQGDLVRLDGSGSSDINGDALIYSWSIVSVPEGSLAQLNDPASVSPSFTADLPGDYVVSLVVTDGLVDSEADNVTIMAISTENAAAQALLETVSAVNGLDPDSLMNKNLANTLTNKINAVLEMIDQGYYEDALDKLQNDILQKTNGCADSGAPDKNDWIKTCEGQAQVYALVMEAIDLLEMLLP